MSETTWQPAGAVQGAAPGFFMTADRLGYTAIVTPEPSGWWRLDITRNGEAVLTAGVYRSKEKAQAAAERFLARHG